MNFTLPNFMSFTDTALKIAERGTSTLKHVAHKQIIHEPSGVPVVAQYVGGELLMLTVTWINSDGAEILSRLMDETGEITHIPLNPEKTAVLK